MTSTDMRCSGPKEPLSTPDAEIQIERGSSARQEKFELVAGHHPRPWKKRTASTRARAAAGAYAGLEGGSVGDDVIGT